MRSVLVHRPVTGRHVFAVGYLPPRTLRRRCIPVRAWPTPAERHMMRHRGETPGGLTVSLCWH